MISALTHQLTRVCCWSTREAILIDSREMGPTGAGQCSNQCVTKQAARQRWRCTVAKADCRPREKKSSITIFPLWNIHIFPKTPSKNYVEMHVTWSKLTLKFTGYCRQTSYTDSTFIHTLVPAVAWELQSQFAPGYMHFNIFFEGVYGKIWIFYNGKLVIELFFLLKSMIGFC